MRMPIINRQYLLKTGVLQPGDQRLYLGRLSQHDDIAGLLV
jgi:hypothetical protein